VDLWFVALICHDGVVLEKIYFWLGWLVCIFYYDD
jgi:hypothetical protein